MNRHEWKTLWRYMRSEKRAGKIAQSEMVRHGGTHWTIHFFANGRDKGVHIHPSCIVDRTPCARVAESLEWSRRYRLEARTHKRNGAYFVRHAANSVVGAKACIADSRAIRLNASAFWN